MSERTSTTTDMIERMQRMTTILASKEGLRWRTVTLRHGVFLAYLQQGRAIVRELRQREENSEWIRIINQHLFRSLMAPVAWDGTWLSALQIPERPAHVTGFADFLTVAEALAQSYRDDPRLSLQGYIAEQLTQVRASGRFFRVVLPVRSCRQDWIEFLGSLPRLDGSPVEAAEKLLVAADQLHACFEPVDCLLHAGMIWERLAGSLHQVFGAPRWAEFLHVRMQGTPVHASFPDYLTTLPWQREVHGDGLYQHLSGDDQSERTGLLRFHQEEFTWEGPSMPVALPVVPPDPILEADLLDEEQDTTDAQQAGDYLGVAFRITTRSRHVLYQPLFRNGSRGTFTILSVPGLRLRKTAAPVPGMLLLCTAPIRGEQAGPGVASVGQWKLLLLARLEKERDNIVQQLRGQIRLRNLHQALQRWSRKSLFDAPRRRAHFLCLCTYLGLPEDQQEQAWRAIRLERRRAIQRGHTWATTKSNQVKKALQDALRDGGNVAALVLEAGGKELYRDDRVRVFLSMVEAVDGTAVARPYNRCNKAYRLKQEQL
jgi:hypothetical protein